MYRSLLSPCTAFTLCTLLDPLYLLEAISITSSLSISLLNSHNCSLLITTSDHSRAIPLFTPSITLGLPSYHEVKRLTYNWMISQDHLEFILLDNRIIIDHVANTNFILTASKTQQIQAVYQIKYKSLNSLQRSTIFNTTICKSARLDNLYIL